MAAEELCHVFRLLMPSVPSEVEEGQTMHQPGVEQGVTSLPVRVPVLSKHAMSTLAASLSCPGYSTLMPRQLSLWRATTMEKIMTAGTPTGMDMTMTLRNLKKAVVLRLSTLGLTLTVGMYIRKQMMKAKT